MQCFSAVVSLEGPPSQLVACLRLCFPACDDSAGKHKSRHIEIGRLERSAA